MQVRFLRFQKQALLLGRSTPSSLPGNSKRIGEVSEAVVLAHLVKSGASVLIPFGDNQRYDFVIDLGSGKFERIQVKTARIRNGCVTFKTSSVSPSGVRKTYVDEADVFFVYCPDNNKIYRILVSECGASLTSLRIKQAKRGLATIRNASNFEV